MTPPHSPTVSACSSDSVQTAPLRGQPSTRKRLAPSQTSALVSVFEVKTHPSREERALLAAELGMELKAVNAWFQNKRRTLKKNCAGCGWSKGSLPENKHVRPANGLKSLPRSESPISLERIAASHELPYKTKPLYARALPRAPLTPRRRAAPETSREIWEYLPSSPPTRPSSPGQHDAVLSLGAKRARSLEWACAKARAGRKASKSLLGRPASGEEDEDDEDEDVPMLVLDGRSPQLGAGGDRGTDTEEEEQEAITPNVSTELLPPLELAAAKSVGKGGQDVDMEAAMALLRFMAPKA
ncbi:hypothetical protein C8Q78DRAFT_1076355 [Trametes maxima]|nr:hypothetical protein C8Q78DRAFT_1076355 [Trametes maxima]